MKNNNNDFLSELNKKWKSYIEEPEHRLFFLFDSLLSEDFLCTKIISLRKMDDWSIGFKSHNATYITTKFKGSNSHETFWGFTVIYSHINRNEYTFDSHEYEYSFLEKFCNICSLENYLN